MPKIPKTVAQLSGPTHLKHTQMLWHLLLLFHVSGKETKVEGVSFKETALGNVRQPNFCLPARYRDTTRF
jgi:hypothetical protein